MSPRELQEAVALENQVTRDRRRPIVQLTGVDGNPFNVLGLCARAARQAGWSEARQREVFEAMRAGTYDHLLATAMEHFDVR